MIRDDYKAAVCYAHAGNNAYARRMLAQLEADARKRYVDHANIAEIYVALGEKDAAFKALEQAYNDSLAKNAKPDGQRCKHAAR